MEKINKYLSVVSIVISLAAIIIATSGRQNLNINRVPAMNNKNSNQVANEQAPGVSAEVKDAAGFLGLPVSDMNTSDNRKQFTMKGHWIIGDKPVFDYLSEKDKTEVSIIVTKDTVVEVAETKPVKNGPVFNGLSVNEFKTVDRNQPLLIIGAGKTDAVSLTAGEIQIYPLIK